MFDLAVNCGPHSAPTCAECPFDKDGILIGETWCNGDCFWEDGQCVDS